MLDEHKKIINEQDDILDDINIGVKKINSISQSIKTELSEQEDLIIEIEEKSDSNLNKIERLTKKTNYLIENSSDNCKWFLLIFLILVLFGLVVILFYF